MAIGTNLEPYIDEWITQQKSRVIGGYFSPREPKEREEFVNEFTPLCEYVLERFLQDTAEQPARNEDE